MKWPHFHVSSIFPTAIFLNYVEICFRTKGNITDCVVPENIHTSPQRVTGNIEGEGGLKGQFFKLEKIVTECSCKKLIYYAY